MEKIVEKKEPCAIQGELSGVAVSEDGLTIKYRLKINVDTSELRADNSCHEVGCEVHVCYEDGEESSKTVLADNEIEAVRNGCLFLAGLLGGKYLHMHK